MVVRERTAFYNALAANSLDSPSYNALIYDLIPYHLFFSHASPLRRRMTMASITAPSTPDQGPTPRRMGTQRSFTVPSKLESSAGSSRGNVEIGASKHVETLYAHPRVRTFKFTVSAGSSRPSSSRQTTSPGDGQPLLQWASPTESTIAVGPLQIYHVPGSASFIKTGRFLHAILPRSQCWCVDGVSKFALRVLRDTYYRFELPGETDEELALVEGMKEILSKVLWFERTPCPFARTFTIDLPDGPDLEVRKGRRRIDGPAKKWRQDRAHSWRPEDGVWPEQQTGSGARSSPAGSESVSDDDSDGSRLEDSTGEDVSAEEKEELADQVKDLAFHTPTRPKAMSSATRSVTAPPQLTLRSTPPSKTRVQERVQGFDDGTIQVKEVTQVEGPSRLDESRLRTFQAIPIDMPPSPPDSSTGHDFMESSLQHQDAITSDEIDDSVIIHGGEAEEPKSVAAETTEIPQSQALRSSVTEDYDAAPEKEQSLDNDIHPEGSTPGLESEGPQYNQPKLQPAFEPNEVESTSATTTSSQVVGSADDPFAAIQARIRARRNVGKLITKRSSSSLTRKTSSTSSSSSSTARASLKPPLSNLAHKRSYSNIPRNQSLASGMVQRAYSVFLGPPAHLVAIMLKIAARLTSGAFGNLFVESPERLGSRIPGSYFLEEELENEEEEDGNVFLEDWEQDDFGVPLRSPVRLAAMESLGEALELEMDQGDDEVEVAGESGRTSSTLD